MIQKQGVLSLNYSRSKLTSLPKEVLENKNSLIQLDVSGNNFTDFSCVLKDLIQLKKLKRLKINIYTQEQAKELIESLPNLEFLNDEPINDENEEIENNVEDKKSNKVDGGKEIVNIPLVKLVDKTFISVFTKFQEFYNLNKEKEKYFQKIIEDFNNLGKRLKISKNINNEKLNIDDINKKMELYRFLFEKLNKIKEEVNSKNNNYNQNSTMILLNVMEENEKIKNKLNIILDSQKQESKNKITKNNSKNIKPIKNKNNLQNSVNNNKLSKNKKQNPEFKNAYSYYKQENKSYNKEKKINNKNNKKLFNKKFHSPANEQIQKESMFISRMNGNNPNKNNNEFNWMNRSYNKILERKKSPIDSNTKSQNRTIFSESKRTPRRSIYSNNKIKKYSKQVILIENYNDPNITNLLIKNKSDIDTLNIFDDESNEQISKDKLNIRIINLNNLLEIINQIYKIRNSRIEKQKQGVYNKSTLEQDLYTYLKSKYGLKSLIIEWNINILSSIQSYIKLNSEVYLFASILKNELDEDSIEILNKIKKTLNNILNLIYDYDVNMVERVKQNKEFLRENEWKIISKCLYSDDNNLRVKFVNKVSNFIDNLIKGQDLVAKTGKKILFSDFLNILIRFNLRLRKKYLHNLFLLFSQQDPKRRGIINLEGFKNIIKNCRIIDDEQKAEEIANDLIEIADKEGSGQITFNDTVQCLDNLDLIMDEGKIKFLDKLSKMNLVE